MVTDQEMDELLKNGDVKGIKAAAQRDPNLIQRGWRDGTFSWIISACLFEHYKVTVPLLIDLGADIDTGQRDFPLENALAGAIVDDRDRNGPFASVDDLDRVPGIGPAKLDAIRDLVTA